MQHRNTKLLHIFHQDFPVGKFEVDVVDALTVFQQPVGEGISALLVQGLDILEINAAKAEANSLDIELCGLL